MRLYISRKRILTAKELQLILRRRNSCWIELKNQGKPKPLFRKGKYGFARNDTKRYFTSVKFAAGRGLLPSQYQLAVCYLLGVGTEKNSQKGLEAMRDAANSGHLMAKSYLAKRLIARPWELIGFVRGVAMLLVVFVKGFILHLHNPGDPRLR